MCTKWRILNVRSQVTRGCKWILFFVHVCDQTIVMCVEGHSHIVHFYWCRSETTGKLITLTINGESIPPGHFCSSSYSSTLDQSYYITCSHLLLHDIGTSRAAHVIFYKSSSSSSSSSGAQPSPRLDAIVDDLAHVSSLSWDQDCVAGRVQSCEARFVLTDLSDVVLWSVRRRFMFARIARDRSARTIWPNKPSRLVVILSIGVSWSKISPGSFPGRCS